MPLDKLTQDLRAKYHIPTDTGNGDGTPRRCAIRSYEFVRSVDVYEDGMPIQKDVIFKIVWAYDLDDVYNPNVLIGDVRRVRRAFIWTNDHYWKPLSKAQTVYLERSEGFGNRSALSRQLFEIKNTMLRRRAKAGLLKPSEQDLASMQRTTGE